MHLSMQAGSRLECLGQGWRTFFAGLLPDLYQTLFANQTCCQKSVPAAPVASLMRYFPLSVCYRLPQFLERPCSLARWFLNSYFVYFTVQNTVEPGYNDTGICDTSYIAPDILSYQLIPHC